MGYGKTLMVIDMKLPPREEIHELAKIILEETESPQGSVFESCRAALRMTALIAMMFEDKRRIVKED